MKNIDVAGVDCHIGSQLTETGPFADTVAKVKDFVSALIKEGMDIRYLDIGGGLGITYDKETPPSPAEYADVIIKGIGDLPCTLILEPGRVIVGNAGILVTRVLYTKKSEDKNFIIVDAGMNDLVRPSLYGAYQGILPLMKNKADMITADIVGPICETGDFLAKGREMQDFEQDDFLAVESAGAYGFTMASNYNSRPKIAEILVNGTEYYTVRNRETYEDLVKHENVPEHIKKADEQL
jgi:diaminopimelate decarboxylase